MPTIKESNATHGGIQIFVICDDGKTLNSPLLSHLFTSMNYSEDDDLIQCLNSPDMDESCTIWQDLILENGEEPERRLLFRILGFKGYMRRLKGLDWPKSRHVCPLSSMHSKILATRGLVVGKIMLSDKIISTKRFRGTCTPKGYGPSARS